MSVTEKLMAAGSFNLQLNKNTTPNTVINKIDAWGHIVIVPGDLNVNEFSDSTLLDASKYTGIVYSLELGDDEIVSINGQGLIAYLGTSDTTGMPIAQTGGPSGVRSYNASTLENVLDHTGSPKGLLRDESGNQGPIRKGTITEPSGTYTGKHYTESALKAIKYVCQDLGVEFKVNQKGFLDAGPTSSLFSGHSTDPTAIIFRGASGEDPNISGIATTSLVAQYDASEFVDTVELVASKYGAEANIGSASVSSNPYKDLFGGALSRVQYISDPQTQGSSKTDRATSYLNELNTLKKTLNVSLEEYDISGDFVVGDKIFIFDPDIGFIDNEVDRVADGRSALFETVYQGQVINPTKIRILGITWPIKQGYGIFYRDKDGNYTELTDYCIFEDGDVQLEVGDVAPTMGESLSMSGYTLDAVGSPDKSVPNQPSGLTEVAGTYSDGNGVSKAFLKLNWTQPTNSDGSTITDGSFYRVRWRVIQDTDGNNILDENDTQVTEYIYSTVDFSTTEFIIYDLSPNTFYEAGVQAVDLTGFDSSFATITSVQTPADAGAPNKPDGFATIASNPLRVQFIHNLGQAKDSDGNAVSPVVNFTLAKDIDHLNIYASTTSGFNLNYNSTTKKVTNSSFKIGELVATSAHIRNGIAAVGYIDLDNADTHYFRVTAVDTSGNESEPSDEQSGSAELIQTSHISNLAVTNALIANAAITNAKVADLSADKITAGTISGQEIILNVSGDTGNDSSIRSSNYSTGSAGWKINSDGSAEFQNATIRGSLHAADIDAGTIDAARLDLSGKLNVGGAASDVNSNSTTIDGGKITANSITASQIAASTITTGQLNFTPYTDGEAIDSGSLGGITIDSDNIRTTNYSSSAGFRIESDGDAFFNDVTARGTISGTVDTSLVAGATGEFKSSSGNDRVEFGGLGGPTLFFVYGSSTTGKINAANNDFLVESVASNDNLILRAGSSGAQAKLTLNANEIEFMGQASGTFAPTINIPHTSDLQFSSTSGSTGDVITKTATGLAWQSTSGHSHGNLSFPNSGTVLSNNNHSHSGFLTSIPNNYLTNSNHQHGNTMNPNSHDNSAHNQNYGFSNLVLGNNSGTATPGTHANSNNAHGINSHTGSNNAHGLGNKANNADFFAHLNLYHGGSDERLKENITETTFGLDYINALRPVDFQYTSASADNLFEDDDPNKDKYLKTKHGFIAQEVRATTLANHSSNNAFGGLGYKDATDNDLFEDIQTLDLQQFIGPLVKSVQQLSAKIEVLQARVDELEG